MDSRPKPQEQLWLAASGNGGAGASPPGARRNPTATEPSAADSRPAARSAAAGGRLALWTQRLFLVIFVIFAIELGMLLAILPWTKVWTQNSLLLAHPDLRAFLNLSFVRGVVSGLGLVDIWIGVWEAVHYHETPRP